MFQFLLNHFVEQLETIVSNTEKAVSDSRTAYQLAGVSLALTGATNATAYQVVPNLNARTVRRVLADVSDTVRTCMLNISSNKEPIHLDSNEIAVLADIQREAERAKVRPQVAMSAVTRYLNAPERVSRVLQDIHALQEAQARVWNPTGLFTRLMRTGQDVKLPERITQSREQAAQVKAEQAAKPVPQVGMLVKLYGEVCNIIEITRQFALVRTSIDDIKVPLDSLRFA